MGSPTVPKSGAVTVFVLRRAGGLWLRRADACWRKGRLGPPKGEASLGSSAVRAGPRRARPFANRECLAFVDRNRDDLAFQ